MIDVAVAALEVGGTASEPDNTLVKNSGRVAAIEVPVATLPVVAVLVVLTAPVPVFVTPLVPELPALPEVPELPLAVKVPLAGIAEPLFGSWTSI